MLIYIICTGNKYYVGQDSQDNYNRLGQHLANGYNLGYNSNSSGGSIGKWGGSKQAIDVLMAKSGYTDTNIAILRDKDNYGLPANVEKTMSDYGWKFAGTPEQKPQALLDLAEQLYIVKYKTELSPEQLTNIQTGGQHSYWVYTFTDLEKLKEDPKFKAAYGNMKSKRFDSLYIHYGDLLNRGGYEKILHPYEYIITRLFTECAMRRLFSPEGSGSAAILNLIARGLARKITKRELEKELANLLRFDVNLWNEWLGKSNNPSFQFKMDTEPLVSQIRNLTEQVWGNISSLIKQHYKEARIYKTVTVKINGETKKISGSQTFKSQPSIASIVSGEPSKLRDELLTKIKEPKWESENSDVWNFLMEVTGLIFERAYAESAARKATVYGATKRGKITTDTLVLKNSPEDTTNIFHTKNRRKDMNTRVFDEYGTATFYHPEDSLSHEVFAWYRQHLGNGSWICQNWNEFYPPMVTIARKRLGAQELINLPEEEVYLNVKKHYFYYERGLKNYPIWKSKSSYAEVGRSRM